MIKMGVITLHEDFTTKTRQGQFVLCFVQDMRTIANTHLICIHFHL